MKILLIDAGNSSLKWSILDGNGVLGNQHRVFYSGSATQNSAEPLSTPSLLEKFSPDKVFESIVVDCAEDCESVVMVSVLGDAFNDKAEKVVAKLLLQFIQIKSVKQLAGITNGYDDFHKLGADRFVAMIAGYELVNKGAIKPKACIIVDIGTATTIDAVDETGTHKGGLILPGINLCVESLLSNTQQLSQWNSKRKKIEHSLFANDTTEAIASASIFGLSSAIDGICKKMEKELKTNKPSLKIKRVICGGSVEQILPFLSSQYTYQDNLVMHGLKVVIENDVSKNVGRDQ